MRQDARVRREFIPECIFYVGCVEINAGSVLLCVS